MSRHRLRPGPGPVGPSARAGVLRCGDHVRVHEPTQTPPWSQIEKRASARSSFIAFLRAKIEVLSSYYKNLGTPTKCKNINLHSARRSCPVVIVWEPTQTPPWSRSCKPASGNFIALGIFFLSLNPCGLYSLSNKDLTRPHPFIVSIATDTDSALVPKLEDPQRAPVGFDVESVRESTRSKSDI